MAFLIFVNLLMGAQILLVQVKEAEEADRELGKAQL